MRHIFALFLTFILLAALPSFAQTSVLLPSCEGGNCAAPNLGLGVSPSKPKPSDTATKAGQTTGTATAGQATGSQYTPSYTTGSRKAVGSSQTNITPGGTVSKSAMDDQKKTEAFMKAAGLAPGRNSAAASNPHIARFQQAVAAYNNRPPVIMDDLDSNLMMKEAMDFPNSIEIGVTPSYLWGANDVKSINQLLGYSAKDIPAQCQLRLEASIRTDRGAYKSISYSGQRTAAKFDGSIKNIRLVPRAVCNTPQGPLPRNGGTLRRVGNKLAMQLRNVNCTLPTQRFSSMEIQYTGDGTANCKFN